MAYEILESNYSEKEIVLAGINIKGLALAKQLATMLAAIGDVEALVVPVKVAAENPVKDEVEVEDPNVAHKKVVIICDDVANTGRTILYAMKPFLSVLPKKVQVAVLVDRKHKRFPITADFVGMLLSTTLQEHIEVELKGSSFKAIYLED
jgi:pyrimidine operon attenuation protein/uracil phosphoribosyltransferase